jgi:hypothetical protein
VASPIRTHQRDSVTRSKPRPQSALITQAVADEDVSTEDPDLVTRSRRPIGAQRKWSFAKPTAGSGASRSEMHGEHAGLEAGRRQRYPLGVLAVIAGLACDVTGADGGVVVVAVALGADLTVLVPACSLATTNAPMTTTALAAMTAGGNLTLFCWSTLTTPFDPGSTAAPRRSLSFQGLKVHGSHATYPRKELSSYALYF